MQRHCSNPLALRSWMRASRALLLAVAAAAMVFPTSIAAPPATQSEQQWLWATAYCIPKETTNQGSGYFSIVEGHNGRLYIGTAKYGENAFLVEFDPAEETMRVVVDVMQLIGSNATGFAAQAKIHTRNNVGESGTIYFGSKQGYAMDGEPLDAYPGGYVMTYNPATGEARHYGIPMPHHGVISVTPDESRGLAYVSTCSDTRPIEETHFMVLDLETGEYRDLGDCRQMYAFIVVDYLGRAYHPVFGGRIARYDPDADRLDYLEQTIDGQPLPAISPDSPDGAAQVEAGVPHVLLAASHPINWDIAPDRRTLYAVAMSGNQLYSYDLTAEGNTLPGRSLGPLLPGATSTDCRAMCVGPSGTVRAAVFGNYPDDASAGAHRRGLHLVSYTPGDAAATDHGVLAISNPDYTEFSDADGNPLLWHHGMETTADGVMTPLYHMGVCEAHDGSVYVTVICPYTVLRIAPESL